MNLPRSSVSKLVQDLEGHLGTKLLERTTRALTMTDAGAAYHQRALGLLADLDDMNSTVANSRAAPRGRLRVDISSILANIILIPALASFQSLYPDIELQLGVSDRPVDLIGEGVDCVIRGGDLADTSLVARKLCELDYVTCATPEYFDGKTKPEHPNDLERHRTVNYFSALSGKMFAMKFTREGEHLDIEGRSQISVNESTAFLGAVLGGLGIGQTFGFAARPYLQSGQLVEVLEDWRPRNHVIQVVYPSNRFPSSKLKVFTDWAIEVFRAYDSRVR